MDRTSMCATDLLIRLASNADGPSIGALAAIAGFDVEVDWSEVEPYWLVAESGSGVIGALQVIPGKPFGRLEMMATHPDLGRFERGRVVKGLLDQGYATLALDGTQIVVALIPFKFKSYQKALSKRGAVVVSSGNLMAKRL